MALYSVHRVLPHALDGASLGSISAPLLSMFTPCPDYVRAYPVDPANAATSGGAHTHTARAATHAWAVTAGRMTERSRSPRPGPAAVVLSGNACMQCCFESFCAPRLSALWARLCMCALSDVRHAWPSRRALGCPCRVLPCADERLVRVKPCRVLVSCAWVPEGARCGARGASACICDVN